MIINEVNNLLQSKCLVKRFYFINQSNGWTLNNGALNFSLFYSDGLHLVEKSNFKLGKSILNAIDSNSNANPYKNAVCFNWNECDFPPLPSLATRCKSIYSPVKYVGLVRKPVCRVFKSFAHGYEPFRSLSYLFVLYPSQCLTVYCINLLLILCLMLVLLEFQLPTFLFHVPNNWHINASIPSFSSKLKTTSSIKSSLSSHQKYAPTFATNSPYSSDQQNVSSPLLQRFLTHRTSDRAVSVTRSILPSNTVDSSANSLNSCYVARPRPLSFRKTKSLVPKSLAPFKTSACINSSVRRVFCLKSF